MRIVINSLRHKSLDLPSNRTSFCGLNVCFIRSMSCNPELLFYGEPASKYDSRSRRAAVRYRDRTQMPFKIR